MPVLRGLLPWWLKPSNGGLRKFLLRCLKRPRFPHLERIGDAVLNRIAPIGYEDEMGFHYGKEGNGSEAGLRGKEIQQPGGAIDPAEGGTSGRASG